MENYEGPIVFLKSIKCIKYKCEIAHVKRNPSSTKIKNFNIPLLFFSIKPS
jgi:hypothetical protein